ncbi:MAG: hypothetical protein RMK98_04635, partial [Bacteroidia bacterium]|nr:hypothetical protein [Bacteroidia bacterium]
DEAITFESPSVDIRTEFLRKSRITYNVLHGIFARVKGSDIAREPLFFFFLFSHKLSRYFIVPPALVLLFISSSILMLQGKIIYTLLFGLQALAWLEAFVFLYMPYVKIPMLLRVPGYFILAHLAQAVGLWRFLKGESVTQVWQRIQRAPLQVVGP